MSPRKEDRITQLLTALERNGVLTIPSSRTQLILRLITFTVLTAITAIVSLAIATAPDNPAGRTTALIIGLLFIALFSTASAATYRQLTQKIQLTLTPQGMRLENESGGIIEQAEWHDIERFTTIRSRLGTITAICYHLTDAGMKRRQEFLNTNPPGRNQFLLIKAPWTEKSRSVTLPSGFIILNSNLLDLLERVHWRQRH